MPSTDAPGDELLRLAASRRPAFRARAGGGARARAEERGLALTSPARSWRKAGQGIEGRRRWPDAFAVGSSAWLARAGLLPAPSDAARRSTERSTPGKARILVGVDGRLAGAVVMADRLRDDARELVDSPAPRGVRTSRW